MDTTLQVPYKDVESRPRGPSTTTLPPPLPPSRPLQPLPSPVPPPERETWAEVLFNFSSDFPDEMTLEVWLPLQFYVLFPTYITLPTHCSLSSET